MYKLNGEVFDINKEHLIGEVNYPRGWFMDATNRAAMGITEEADPVYVPPAPTLAEAQTGKEFEIRGKGSMFMLQIVTPYTSEERDTWPSQVSEAKAYSDNPASPTPMLTALCAQRGNTVADQAARILGNEAAFKTAVGTILGVQQAKLDLIAAATTAEQVNAITWEG